MQNNLINQSKQLAGAAGAVVAFMPEETGEYVVVVGDGEVFDRGGGNITVSQDGIAFTDLSAITAATRKTITAVGGHGIYCTLGGGASGADTKIGIYQIGSYPRLVSSSSSSSG